MQGSVGFGMNLIAVPVLLLVVIAGQRTVSGVDPEYQSSAKSVGAGATTGTRIGAEPDTATHLIALSPVENGCSVEVTRQFYRQYVSSSGTSGREFVWYMKNLGTTTCSAERMVSRI